MILRVCYDTEGKGMEREPQRIFVVQRHMQALGSLAERYADAILTVQGVFVGSWGEMHTSRFLRPDQICLLAQTGSMVPATRARLGLVDRLFSRVGASDNLAQGQSTFMVEMMETARILRQATKRSLVILDEIGRGTSTYDGVALAWAVVEDLAARAHGEVRTLFATHYHELSVMADESSHIKNYTVSVKERGKEITFLRRIVPGCADRSYGIHVARLAGLPESLLKRADEILQGLEEEGNNPAPVKSAPEKQASPGLDLFTSPIIDELAHMDVMSKTPIEAMEILFRLSKEAKEGR